MKKLILLILIASFNLTFAQEQSTIQGKIIDENFEPLVNVLIKNLNSGVQYRTNQYGEFHGRADRNDTLQFQYISLRTEKIPIETSDQNIHLIMVEDYYPEFGTEKIYRKFEKAEKKRIKNMYKLADKKGVWEK